jgi:Ca2+-binding RTX toxin-like protein
MATLQGTAGNDTLQGSELADELSGLGGDDRLEGLGGADRLKGGTGRDTLLGGNGGDTLDGGSGADALTGGAGNDTYFVDSIADLLTELGGGGDDQVQSRVSHTLSANIERLVLLGSAVRGTGNELANTLLGNAAANWLRGLAGMDRIGGGPGSDTLDGGTGRDFLDGGPGDDSYFVDQARDVVSESRLAADGGRDIVYAQVSWALGAYQEELVLLGTGNLNGAGNAQDNVLFGNSGDNLLNGSFGIDTLHGGRGNDTYFLDSYGDTVIEFPDPLIGGIDRVYASFSYALGAGEDELVLVGTHALDGEGNAHANTLTGQSGDNALQGHGGDDTLSGEGGNDSLAGGPGHDLIRGGAGRDVFLLDGAGTNADLIEDFSSGADRLALPQGELDLPGGVLDARHLRQGPGVVAAQDADDRLVYDTTTGRLYLDRDGAGGAEPVQLAQLSGDAPPVLSAADVFVVTSSHLGSIGGTIDTLVSSVDFTVPGTVRDVDLRLTGSAIEGGGNDFENSIAGNEFGNLLRGYGGRDSLAGGAGDDTLDGGAGIDRLLGGGGGDVFQLNYPGDNDLIGDFNAGEDRLLLNLRVFAGITGSAGEPLDAALFRSGPGARTADSATVRIIYDTTEGVLYYDADGLDTGPDDLPPVPVALLGNDTHPVLAATDIVLGDELLQSHGTTRTFSSVVLAAGGRFHNVRLEGTADLDATGNDEDNELIGNAGANRIFGQRGDDTLIGYEGDDTFDGGEGDDTYYVDDTGDVVEEGEAAPAGTAVHALGDEDTLPAATGGGIDTVIAQVSYTLRANIENLVLEGNDDVSGTGNELANVITGNGGDNLLAAAGGNDIVDGAIGNDSIDGGAGNDTLGGGDGTDTIGGGAGADNLLGGSGNDTLAGGTGNDTLGGEKGSDRFSFDTALGSGNVDTLTDFTSGSEKIQLDDDVFRSFNAASATALTAGQFLSAAGATAATTSTQRIVYDTTSGALYYDEDGSGGIAPVKFAVLGTGTHPALAVTDFLIVD